MDKWKDPDWPTPVGAGLIFVAFLMLRGDEPSPMSFLVGALGIALLIFGLMRRDRAKQERRAPEPVTAEPAPEARRREDV